MKNQYKPTKLKTTKSKKESNKVKQPKAEKMTNVVTGKVTTIKFGKPKKTKELKPVKQPKATPQVAAVPTKFDKVRKFEKAGKLQFPFNKKVLAAVLGGVVIVLAAMWLLISLQNTEQVVEPRSLAVLTYPDKTTYYVGERASFSDLKLKMTMTNGVEITLDGSECKITGFDSSAPAENQVITVEYRGLQTSFMVSISEMPVTITGNYVGLSFKSLPKTEYKVGEWPDTTGGVLMVHYDDGTTREMALNNDIIYGFNTYQAGTYTVTVKYVENNRYAETTYTITVTEE